MSNKKTKIVPCASGVPAMTLQPVISDALFEQLKETINISIHELVFAAQFLDDDEIEEAQNCLTTIALNVESLQNQITIAAREAL